MMDGLFVVRINICIYIRNMMLMLDDNSRWKKMNINMKITVLVVFFLGSK